MHLHGFDMVAAIQTTSKHRLRLYFSGVFFWQPSGVYFLDLKPNFQPVFYPTVN